MALLLDIGRCEIEKKRTGERWRYPLALGSGLDPLLLICKVFCFNVKILGSILGRTT